tara:strand:- start:36 stop:1118 length:1083 start_codon:yes stop_codon:yes gene_type:complete
MSRDAYIAGRYGGSRPSGSSPSEDKSYDAGQAERRREQDGPSKTIVPPDSKTGKTEYEQARTIAENVAKQGQFKDPYDVLTREEEIAVGFPQTGIEKLMQTTGIKIPNLSLQGLGIAGKTFGTLLDSVFKPKASTFKGQNNLSIIKNLVKPEDLFDYYNTYRDVINEAGFDTGSDFIKAIESAPEFGVQGTESQRRADPASYYDKDLFVDSGEQDEMLKDYPEFLEKMGLKPMSSRFAQTTGNLVDIASIPVTPEMQGNNPEFAKRIFEARMELDRMGRDSSGNPQGGIMTASSAPPAPPPVVPPAEDEVPENPILNPVMSQRDPFNLAQFYASLPQYTRQGVMSPNLASYYDNLRRFYG